MTYNGIKLPQTIRTSRIISAFANEIEPEKVSKYADIMKTEMLSHSFPPIMGYPSIISEDDDGKEFLNGMEIDESHIGTLVWFVTDGHHRSLAAIEAGIPYLEVELDYSTITCEKDLLQFK